MDIETVKHIITGFFGKKYSKESRHLFGSWLRADNNQEEKEESLHTLWDELEGKPYMHVSSDWQSLKPKLKTSRKKIFLSKVTKYAAVIVLIILGGITAIWFMNRTEPVDGIQMKECFVAFGDSRQIYLEDGSEVWLNAGSLLVYPDNFGKMNNRTVYLTGEAYFSVTTDTQKPFIVNTSLVDIEALGTRFTVEAYPNEEITRATLEEGSIRVDMRENSESIILKPSQQLVYTHKDRSYQLHGIDINMFNLSREGYLIFENATFVELIHSIERKYKVTVQFNSAKYAEEFYNVKFAPHETLEDALLVLQDLTGIDFQIKGNFVYIR